MSKINQINYNIIPNNDKTTEETISQTLEYENAETYNKDGIFANSIVENHAYSNKYLDNLMTSFLNIKEKMQINTKEDVNNTKTTTTKGREKSQDIQNSDSMYNQINWADKYGYCYELGESIANAALKYDYPDGDGGYCLAGVVYILTNFFKNDYNTFEGFHHTLTGREGVNSAYKLAEALRGNKPKEGFYADVGKYYHEYDSEDISRSELSELPAGCIVIWNKCGETCNEHKHGHVAITIGDGTEISDVKRQQTTDLCICDFPEEEWEYTVFMPVGLRDREDINTELQFKE